MRMIRLWLIGLGLWLACATSASAITYARVTVSTSATLLYTAPTSGAGRVLVRNPSAVSLYVGDINVTTATGFEIAAGDALAVNLSNGDRLYGIIVAATQVIHTVSGANPQ